MGFAELVDAPLKDRELTGPEVELLKWLSDACPRAEKAQPEREQAPQSSVTGTSAATL